MQSVTDWNKPKMKPPHVPSCHPWMLVCSHNTFQFWQTPYSDTSVVWRKALSHLWGSRASTLRHRTQAERSLVRKQVPIRCRAGQKTFYHGCNNLFLVFYIPLWRFHTQIARVFFCPHLAVLWAVWIPPQRTHYTVAEGYHNHPGMRWLSHGALLNTAVRWPSWRINIRSMEKCSLRGKVCY